ncbi:peptidoglycan DD-metalloendopeptidase family protein [Adhaeribacter terreus]|uniref:Peptidoglycan DD-metalloendopeptidase family protein n=1 Tax=Adhaeribacter terreus TaxID=529703 RepID=A0ABW0EAK8_9BACT
MLSSFSVMAQGKKPPVKTTPAKSIQKSRKDMFKIKAPKIQYVRPDTAILVEYDEFPEDTSDAANSVFFNPSKQLSIVSEDTSTLDLGEQQIVEMSEEVLIDSTWIKVAGYYAIWDTHNINPYRKDGRNLKDTLHIHLEEPEKKRYAKMPLEKTPITSDFGFRGYRWHYGTDIDLNTGDTIYAAFDGVIRISKWDGGGYGNYIVVRHYNGLETLYGHMSRPLVNVGTFVKAGEAIGLGGSTGRSSGPHLHYEVRYEGNPIDPERLYDFPDYKLISKDFTITSALFNYYNSALKYKKGGSRSGATSARRAAYHKVRSGDTISEIARKYGVSQAQIMRLNRITGKTVLKLGRSLRIR